MNRKKASSKLKISSKTKQKPKHFKQTIKRLLNYLGKYKLGLIGAMMAAIAATLCNLAAPYILSRVLDTIQNRMMNQTEIPFTRVGYILGILTVLYIAHVLFSLIQGNVMTHLTQKTMFQLRKDIATKMMKLPLGYFDTHSKGDILSRTTNDVDTIGTSLQQVATQLIAYMITIIGSIVLMFSISIPLTLLCLLTIPLSMVSTKVILKKSQTYIRKQMKHLGDLNGMVEETFSGINVIKAFCYEEEALNQFDKVNEQFYLTAKEGQFRASTMNPTSTAFTNLAYTFICVIGAYQVITGTLSLGGIIALVQYQKQYASPLGQLTNLMNALQTAVAAAERVFEFLDEVEEEVVLTKETLPNQVQGEVEFKHLQFGYTPDKMLMKDINVKVKAGQKVAIVGPTGAGKTTLINLLLRFYETNGGQITIDGVDIKALSRADVRKNFSMVLQDTWLFNGTIAENLRYGNKDLSADTLQEIGKEAQIDFLISTMPEGYDTIINEEGSNISQGQKQLLTIARAMAAKSPILILDEATSSVDTRTESLIQTAMNRLMKGKTSFIIAHRLSTIKDADQILVMKSGNIVEQGTHDTLLQENGLYAKLYNSQFEKV
ncbi:MAG: ABC transporter ATP-binding protein [Cellulosilyticum sp.]|nr:ABC transporter ATP-binding protein [Cellulosilyticum sp.]